MGSFLTSYVSGRIFSTPSSLSDPFYTLSFIISSGFASLPTSNIFYESVKFSFFKSRATGNTSDTVPWSFVLHPFSYKTVFALFLAEETSFS